MAIRRTEGLIKTLAAGGDINPRRIVRYGADADTVVQASASSQTLLGVSKVPDALLDPIVLGAAAPTIKAVAGNAVDVILDGVAEVEYGGTVAVGDLLTTDSVGRAIAAAAPLASNIRTIGMATVAGVTGSIGCVLLNRQSLSGFAGTGNTPHSATFTVGSEATDVITVAVQVNDITGTALTSRAMVFGYLASDANGDTVATATSGGLAAGTDGTLIEVVNNVAFHAITEADGDLDVAITHNSTGTYYLVLNIAGRMYVSGAITFA